MITYAIPDLGLDDWNPRDTAATAELRAPADDTECWRGERHYWSESSDDERVAVEPIVALLASSCSTTAAGSDLRDARVLQHLKLCETGPESGTVSVSIRAYNATVADRRSKRARAFDVVFDLWRLGRSELGHPYMMYPFASGIKYMQTIADAMRASAYAYEAGTEMPGPVPHDVDISGSDVEHPWQRIDDAPVWRWIEQSVPDA